MANAAPNMDESQVAVQRLKDLEAQASTAVADATAAKADAVAAQGDLDRANVEIASLRSQNERLQQQLAAANVASTQPDALPTLPVELPKGAAQLLESVTIAALTDKGESVRKQAKRGDVLFAAPKPGALDELQAAIGTVARVHAVDKATFEELRGLKHLR